MPCFKPLQANFSLREDGKKDIQFSNVSAQLFASGVSTVSEGLSIPCGRCIGCRLERSRQWATRCMHEAELYDDNVFLTLTINPDNLSKMCPDGSLNRKHMQDFIKRLRKKFSDRKIRTFYCGEYGESLNRPHYHAIIFNLDFPDKVFWKSQNGCDYYVSDLLSVLWPFGFSTIGSVTFESCAYVARYCTKKVTGDMAKDHYKGRLPEFSQASLKPGIGRDWIDKFGKTDVFPFDEVIVRGVRCKPPRYYDKVLEVIDPVSFAGLKDQRKAYGLLKQDDNTFRRLRVKEEVQSRRFQKLVRTMESDYV